MYEYIFDYRFSVNERSLREIFTNLIVSDINSEFQGVSGLNIRWLRDWAVDATMNENDFWEGFSKEARERKLIRESWFTNNEFHLALENVRNFVEKTYPKWYEREREEVFRQIGLEAGAGSDFLINHFPRISGRRVEDLAYYAQVSASATTHLRQVEVIEPVENEEGSKYTHTVGINVTTFPGAITQRSAAEWFAGRCMKQLRVSTDDVGKLNLEFNQSDGSFILEVPFTPKNPNSVDNSFRRRLKKIAGVAMSIQRDKAKLRHSILDKRASLYRSVMEERLSNLEIAHEGTSRHTQRVSLLSILFGRLIGAPQETLRVLAMGGPVHDYLKIGVPHSILHKEGPFSFWWERMIMQTHSGRTPNVILERELKLLHENFPDLTPDEKERYEREISQAAMLGSEHQEGFNGLLYPYRAKADQISLAGLIIKICDVYDALISNRTYKEGYDPKKTTKIMRACLEDGDFHPILGEFFIGELEPFLYTLGYCVDAFHFDTNGREPGLLEKKLIAYLRGNNNDFDLKIPNNVREFVRDYKQSVVYTPQGIRAINDIYMKGLITKIDLLSRAERLRKDITENRSIERTAIVKDFLEATEIFDMKPQNHAMHMSRIEDSLQGLLRFSELLSNVETPQSNYQIKILRELIPQREYPLVTNLDVKSMSQRDAYGVFEKRN